MCSWNRPWYIPKMIESVKNQTMQPADFIIWNNNPKMRDKLEAAVGNHNITLHHHDKNVGGFGRFYAARDLTKTKYVVFIDDDWVLKPKQLEHLYSVRDPKSIVGLWCWKYNRKAERSRVTSGDCDYVGTCGQISPRSIYKNDGLYKCPEKYWFIEDIWLSFYAKHELGIKLTSSGKLENHAKNMNRDDKGNLIEKVPGLSNKVWDLKPAFIKYLIGRYW
jgi:GT2 family glycosyltransferase